MISSDHQGVTSLFQSPSSALSYCLWYHSLLEQSLSMECFLSRLERMGEHLRPCHSSAPEPSRYSLHAYVLQDLVGLTAAGCHVISPSSLSLQAQKVRVRSLPVARGQCNCTLPRLPCPAWSLIPQFICSVCRPLGNGC